MTIVWIVRAKSEAEAGLGWVTDISDTRDGVTHSDRRTVCVHVTVCRKVGSGQTAVRYS